MTQMPNGPTTSILQRISFPGSHRCSSRPPHNLSLLIVTGGNPWFPAVSRRDLEGRTRNDGWISLRNAGAFLPNLEGCLILPPSFKALKTHELWVEHRLHIQYIDRLPIEASATGSGFSAPSSCPSPGADRPSPSILIEGDSSCSSRTTSPGWSHDLSAQYSQQTTARSQLVLRHGPPTIFCILCSTYDSNQFYPEVVCGQTVLCRPLFWPGLTRPRPWRAEAPIVLLSAYTIHRAPPLDPSERYPVPQFVAATEGSTRANGVPRSPDLGWRDGLPRYNRQRGTSPA